MKFGDNDVIGFAPLSDESGTFTGNIELPSAYISYGAKSATMSIYDSNNDLIVTSNAVEITVEAAPEPGHPVPDVPYEQLAITLSTNDDHDELEFVGGFHDSETSANITDTDISNVEFIIDNTYSATVSYDSVSNHLTISHVFEGAYTGTVPETGVLAFTYNGEGVQITLALEDLRE